MTTREYTTPEVEILMLSDEDIITTSDEFVFLPPDEFGEI